MRRGRCRNQSAEDWSRASWSSAGAHRRDQTRRDRRREAATGNLPDNASAENVRRQVARLKNSPPVVKNSYAGKKIDIIGGVYDVATGKVAIV